MGDLEQRVGNWWPSEEWGEEAGRSDQGGTTPADRYGSDGPGAGPDVSDVSATEGQRPVSMAIRASSPQDLRSSRGGGGSLPSGPPH